MLTRSHMHTFSSDDNRVLVRITESAKGARVDVDRYGMNAREIIDLIDALATTIGEFAPENGHLLQAVLDKHAQSLPSSSRTSQ